MVSKPEAVLVPEAGFEPAHSFERHPLKMVCLPNSTTPARFLIRFALVPSPLLPLPLEPPGLQQGPPGLLSQTE